MHLYFPANGMLYSFTLIAMIFFFGGVCASIVLWKKGKAKSLHHEVNYGAVLKAFVFNCLLQVQILKISFLRWFMHICIFVGFLGLFAQTTFMAIMSHFLPENSPLAATFFDSQGGAGAHVLDVWGDVFGLMLLAGVLIALVRRYVVRSKQLDTISQDTVTIMLLAFIAITGFLGESIRLTDPLYASVHSYSFVGSFIADIFSKFGVEQIRHGFYILSIIIHAIVSFYFMGYIPFSKAWHIFVSPIEIVLDASERA
jgi:heterodisulfide reductase subunit E